MQNNLLTSEYVRNLAYLAGHLANDADNEFSKCGQTVFKDSWGDRRYDSRQQRRETWPQYLQDLCSDFQSASNVRHQVHGACDLLNDYLERASIPERDRADWQTETMRASLKIAREKLSQAEYHLQSRYSDGHPADPELRAKCLDAIGAIRRLEAIHNAGTLAATV